MKPRTSTGEEELQGWTQHRPDVTTEETHDTQRKMKCRVKPEGWSTACLE